MKREVSLEEISDGKLYTSNDMVKADCQDCVGCSACCHGMGSSIVLDPLDVYRMSTESGYTFEELLGIGLELNVVDGIILPNLKMTGNDESCVFLNAEGRCSIHSIRPGICRLFPLGRYYEDGSFSYFLQIHECAKENRTKVKVKKWLDTPDIKKYETFISDWHYYLLELQDKLTNPAGDFDEATMKQISMQVLQTFFLTPYQSGDFYTQFYKRLEEIREM